MGDLLIMSKKERQRKAVVEQILSGHMSRGDAAKRLRVGERQLKRIIASYRKYGDAGLVHKHRGKSSNRAVSAKTKKKALKLYEAKYEGFGPTLASEKLEEDDHLFVKAETLRLWLKAEGLWLPSRKRKLHRTRRARRARFGEMLQLDGSIHAWFKGVDEKQCLMNMVDDATGKTLSLMDYGETTRSALSLLKWWIRDAGIPLSIYVDLKSLYVSPKSLKQKAAEGEELIEPEWLTHFSSACKKLGIEIIKAYSAQAKGRVERNHAVYQDRFVKELALKKITTIKAANKLLSGGFVNKLNEKFAKAAASEEDAHVALFSDDDLDQILCWEYTRQLKNDWTAQFDNQHYQIEKSNVIKVQPKQKIIVRRHLDESISLWCGKRALDFKAIEKPMKPKKAATKEHSSTKKAEHARKNKHKTPWGTFNPDWLNARKGEKASSLAKT